MVKCKRCGSDKTVKNGKVREKQRYLCKQCGCHFVEGDKRENNDTFFLKTLCTLFRILGAGNYKVIGEFLHRDTSQICRWISEAPDNYKRWRGHSTRKPRNFDELLEDLKTSEVINGEDMLLIDNAIDDLYVGVIVQRRKRQ